MSDLPSEGTLARPLRLDPFQRIIEVGWGGKIGILEVTSDTFDVTEVTSEDPLGLPFAAPLYQFWNAQSDTELFQGVLIDRAHWRDKYVLQPDISKIVSEGEYVEEPAHTLYYIDSYIDYPTGREDDFHISEQQSEMTTARGYGPTITLVDKVYNLGFVLGQFLPTELAAAAHANLGWDGRVVSFTDLFESTPAEPGRTVIYWTRSQDFPPTTGTNHRERTSYLINFARVRQLKVVLSARPRPSGAPQPSLAPDQWSLKWYAPADVLINAEEATMAPASGALPVIQLSGSSPAGERQEIRFNAKGLVP